ncbi:ATP synthase F(0) complex subunit f, mitochondrial isoform X1 [Poecilia latipinna]|uniref:ATP synthase membrane subunit f n=2 Tax=Poecilia TaxID=8080 RepID=A0A087YAD7_POEFO|nr:PREDICTED: ATP synthase subunit f, mitochondrial isoform X1 [Poecilia formosa]XP_014871871.1 PREDICTED: ATP synthase subunit f, mitochondrial-like isoform X1 [Poecilia latipinna]
MTPCPTMHFLFLFPSFPAATPPAPVKMADKAVPVVEKSLADVKLKELPRWLAGRDLTPNGLVRGVTGGYDWYYKKYINVKKGGIGGISMFLFGYVVISYVWSFDHIKHDRWRKYH